MKDAIDELITYREQFGPLSPMMKRLRRFHRAKPEVLDFLILELRAVRANGWPKVSMGSLWHYMRWTLISKQRVPGETFVVTQNLCSYYARLIVILCPEFNGFFELLKCKADEDFGLTFESAHPGKVRRLLWADGTPIEQGWRPTVAYEPKPVRRRKPVVRAA